MGKHTEQSDMASGRNTQKGKGRPNLPGRPFPNYLRQDDVAEVQHVVATLGQVDTFTDTP